MSSHKSNWLSVQGGIGHWGVGESSTLCGRCEGGTQGGIGHWGGGESSTLCGRCDGGTQGGIGHWGGGGGGGRVVYTVWEV